MRMSLTLNLQTLFSNISFNTCSLKHLQLMITFDPQIDTISAHTPTVLSSISLIHSLLHRLLSQAMVNSLYGFKCASFTIELMSTNRHTLRSIVCNNGSHLLLMSTVDSAQLAAQVCK